MRFSGTGGYACAKPDSFSLVWAQTTDHAGLGLGPGVVRPHAPTQNRYAADRDHFPPFATHCHRMLRVNFNQAMNSRLDTSDRFLESLNRLSGLIGKICKYSRTRERKDTFLKRYI